MLEHIHSHKPNSANEVIERLSAEFVCAVSKSKFEIFVDGEEDDEEEFEEVEVEVEEEEEEVEVSTTEEEKSFIGMTNVVTKTLLLMTYEYNHSSSYTPVISSPTPPGK